MKKGKLIVIDGTDGSGKATQVAKLKERLLREDIQVVSLDFPRYYDNFFGELIGKGLAGELGDWVGLHPKIASVIYAADRFESKQEIEKYLDEGKIVILDRYVSSNQIHQGGKIKDEKERKDFLQWLDTMEHDVFGLPRPDIILYLHLPLSITQTLLLAKENQKKKKYLSGKCDQHEGNEKHLADAKETGLQIIAEKNNWKKITCFIEEEVLPIDTIHEKIYQIISKIIYE